jgi:hypothetical protein
MTDAPRVFISHATEDNDRFVVGFAERLRREKGVDAWLDLWEMFPGDKIVDKIFNHGLKPSDVVIVVLSSVSIHKPWVQKELDIAVVKNIEDKTRLIPVRLDGCRIPECLRDTLYQTINDPNSYDAEFDRIVSIIYGRYDKPPLGSRPAYTDPGVLQLDNLCRNDSLFLAEACRIALEQGHPTILDTGPLTASLSTKGVSEQDMMESQDVLASRYYIETHRTMGPPHVYVFDIKTAGFRLFAEAGGIPDYAKDITDVGRMLVEQVIVNGGMGSNSSIETELGLPAMLVEHILERLRDNGQIKYETEMGGRLFMHIYWVSPELRRKLEGNATAGI